MATRDESHLFSLAALTTRSPAPPRPQTRAPETGDLELHPAPVPSEAGWPLFPLGAPLGGPVDAPAAIQSPSAAGRGRTVVLVVAASLLGAGIVGAAAWSSEPATPSPTLGPEVPTETIAQPVPAATAPAPPEATPAPPAAATAPPEVTRAPSEPAPVTSAAPPPPSKPPRRNARPPAPPSQNRGVTPPSPPPTRGPCSHCAAGDLACNIKCRAG